MDDGAVFDGHAGTQHDVRLDRHVAADFRIHRQKDRLGRDQRRPAEHRLRAQPPLHRGLRARELDAVVHTHDLLFVGQARRRGEALARGDFDQVGQIEFARGVVVAHGFEQLERPRAGNRHRSGVAASDRAFRLGRIFLLANRDQRAVALDESAVARRIGGLEAERDQPCPLGQTAAQAEQRFRAKQRPVGVDHENVVPAAPDRRAGGEHGVRRAASLLLDMDFYVALLPSRLGCDRIRAGPDDHRDSFGAGAGQRRQRVSEHRTSRDLMQRFGSRRTHPHPLPGCQQDAEAGASAGRVGRRSGHRFLLTRRSRGCNAERDNRGS